MIKFYDNKSNLLFCLRLDFVKILEDSTWFLFIYL